MKILDHPTPRSIIEEAANAQPQSDRASFLYIEKELASNGISDPNTYDSNPEAILIRTFDGKSIARLTDQATEVPDTGSNGAMMWTQLHGEREVAFLEGLREAFRQQQTTSDEGEPSSDDVLDDANPVVQPL